MKTSHPFDRPGGRPPRKAPPPPPLCCDGGYIVEKIVQRQSESLCFEGFLPLNALPNDLCGTLSLCAVEVLQIRPCQGGLSPCGCGGERLELTLLCTVADARGCSAQVCASIEVESFARASCGSQGLNLRRGAEVCVGFARFCPPCGFEVSLRIALHTVLSRSELTSSRPSCPAACPQPLPLYPPPIRRLR